MNDMELIREKVAEIIEQPCNVCELEDNCDCKMRGIICPYQEKKADQLLSLEFPANGKTIRIGAYYPEAKLPEMPIYKDTEGNILPMRFTDRGILQVMKEAGFVKLIKGEKVE